MNPKTRKTIYLGIIILLAGSMAFALSYYNYIKESEHQTARKQNELTTIASLKSKQLYEWKSERETDAKYLAGNTYVKTTLMHLCDNPEDINIKDEITSWLKPIAENKEYNDVMVVSDKGKVLISVTGKSVMLSSKQKANIKKSMGKKVYFSDIYLDKKDSACIDLIVPYTCCKPGVCGPCAISIMLEINPYHNLYPIIASWPTNSPSAETQLVEKDANSDSVVYLSNLRYQKNAILKFKRSLNDTLIPAVMAVSGKTGLYFAIDYCGVNVLTYSTKIDGTPWFMITKVDKAEISKPILDAQEWFAATTGVILLLIAISFWMIWSRKNAKNLRMLYEAQLHESNAIAESLQATEKFRLLAEQSGVEIVLVDKEGRCLYLNERALNSLGDIARSYKGKAFAEIFGEPAANVYVKRFKDAIASDAPLVYEDKTTQNNQEIWLYSNLTKVINSKGEIEGIQMVSYDITERKQMEEELKESEFFFRESQRAASIGSYKTDFIKGFWESSEILDNIFGIDKNYSRSIKSWLDIVHPDDRQMMDNYLNEEILGKRKDFHKEYRIIRICNKSVLWVLGIGKVSFDNDGNIVSMIGTIQDITQRKQSEMKLFQSNELLRSFLRHSPIYAYIKDVTPNESRIIEISDNYSDMLNIDVYNAKGKSMHELFPPEFATQMTYDDWAVVSEKKELVIEEHFNDRIYTSIKFPIIFEDRKLLAGYTLDITEQKHSEFLLYESEQKFRTIFNATPVPVGLNDNDQNILLLNEEFVKTFGYTIEDIPTVKEWSVRAYPDPVYRNWEATTWNKHFEDAIQSGKQFEPIEANIKCKDGSIKTVIIELSFLEGSGSGSSNQLVIFHDITERIKAENDLKNSVSMLTATLESTADGILVIDKNRQIANYNKKFIEMWQIPPAIIKTKDGRKLMEFVANKNNKPSEFISRIEEIYYNETESSFDVLQIKEGLVYERLSQPQKIDNSIIGRVWCFRDITKNMLAEEKLKESEHRFRATFMTATDAMYLATLEEGLIIIANDSFESVLGYKPSEVINKTSSELNLYENSWDRLKIVEELKEYGLVKQKELKARRKSGDIIDVSLSISTLKIKNTMHILGIIRDITFRKQSEALLIERMQYLEKSNEFMVNREIKMIALKKEINQLLLKIGEEKRYTIVE